MEFRILGRLEVESNGQPVELGGARQRALLAVLLLHANTVVSRDRLIESVWGEQPPDTAPTALQVYVSGLRKKLGPDRIVTRTPGYLLRADPKSIDLGRFEALVQSGREALAAGDPSTASQELAEALELWRGEPLADLDAAPVAQTERLRFDEIRLGAIEDRVEADLDLGRHEAQIAELQALVRDHPFRERLRSQLMIALYRSGRQAEALDAYQQGRHRLVDELGIEPGEPLKALQRAILGQDPGLESVVPARPGSSETRHPRFVMRPRLAAVSAVVIAAGAAAAISIALTGGGHKTIAVVPNSVAVLDSQTDRLVGDVPVGERPVSIVGGEGGIWVANAGDSTLTRIDPRTSKVVKVLGIGTHLHDLATGFGSVWTANGEDGTVTRIDARRDEPVATLHFGAGPEQPVLWVATGARSVWATRGDTLLQIDPASDRLRRRIRIPSPAGLAAGPRGAWVLTTDHRLVRVSPEGAVTTVTAPLGKAALAPATGDGSLWLVVYAGRGQIWRIDPESVGVSATTAGRYPAVTAMTKTGLYPLDVAVGRDAVWAVDVDGTVLRIDPTKADVVSRTPTAPTIRSALAIEDGKIWVAIQDGD
jgi:DNA-binding SARP family transcriptional activator/DNA-binding beta-propeller fold protein YncE